MHRSTATIALVVVALSAPTVALAGGTIKTTIKNGVWSDPTLWDLGSVPDQGLGEQAYLDHLVSLDGAGGEAVATAVGVNSPSTLTIGTGTLDAGGLFVGLASNGTLEQSGGTINATVFHVGWQAPGIFNIDGGTLQTTQDMEIGSALGGTPAGDMTITGNAASISTTAGLDLLASGTLTIEPTANGAAGISTIAASGNVTFGSGATLALDISSYSPSMGDSWDVISYGGSVSGPAANVVAPPGYTVVEDRGTSGLIKLTVTGVPAAPGVSGFGVALLAVLLVMVGAFALRPLAVRVGSAS